jgi:hypothetical protein
MSHWLSNKGKYGLIQGQWEDAGGTAIGEGLLVGASTPAAIDTEAEIQDLNTVGELLALTGVDEPVGGWYSRQNLTRSAAVEDDTNNRVNMDTANVTHTAASAGETIYGGFIADNTVNTNDTTRLFWSLMLWTPVPLNGSDLTLTITDLYRAV